MAGLAQHAAGSGCAGPSEMVLEGDFDGSVLRPLSQGSTSAGDSMQGHAPSAHVRAAAAILSPPSTDDASEVSDEDGPFVTPRPAPQHSARQQTVTAQPPAQRRTSRVLAAARPQAAVVSSDAGVAQPSVDGNISGTRPVPLPPPPAHLSPDQVQQQTSSDRAGHITSASAPGAAKMSGMLSTQRPADGYPQAQTQGKTGCVQRAAPAPAVPAEGSAAPSAGQQAIVHSVLAILRGAERQGIEPDAVMAQVQTALHDQHGVESSVRTNGAAPAQAAVPALASQTQPPVVDEQAQPDTLRAGTASGEDASVPAPTASAQVTQVPRGQQQQQPGGRLHGADAAEAIAASQQAEPHAQQALQHWRLRLHSGVDRSIRVGLHGLAMLDGNGDRCAPRR